MIYSIYNNIISKRHSRKAAERNEMLALILAATLNICPVCGNYDAVCLVNNEIVTVHESEDAVPGDIYSVTTENGTFSLAQYIGYIY